MSDSKILSKVADVREALLENERLPAPEVVDVVVVGAGAAGIGTAFRAHELGLSVLVIERDDVLSVLRDWVYSVKDYVDADYNSAARKTPFPRGGELVASLVYENHSLASELYHRWVKVFVDHKLPVRTGAVLQNRGGESGKQAAVPTTRNPPTTLPRQRGPVKAPPPPSLIRAFRPASCPTARTRPHRDPPAAA